MLRKEKMKRNIEFNVLHTHMSNLIYNEEDIQ